MSDKDIAGSELKDKLRELIAMYGLNVEVTDESVGDGDLLLQDIMQAIQNHDTEIKQQAIQAFGEKQIEAFEKAIYRYELTRDYPEGNLSKPIMEYYRTSIQEAMQSTSPDGSGE